MEAKYDKNKGTTKLTSEPVKQEENDNFDDMLAGLKI